MQMARQLAPSPLDRTKRRRGQVNYADSHTPQAKARASAKAAQDQAAKPDSGSSSIGSGVDTGAVGSSDEEGTELEPEGKVGAGSKTDIEKRGRAQMGL